MAGLRVDAARVVADLRELDGLTGGSGGAQRVSWTDGWRAARALLRARLAEIGISIDQDEAGNAWAYLRGARAETVALGSHLDSVPGGGWLDGTLGVMAALGVLRACVATGQTPARTVALVDWADEEGARFGRSLFGSSAVAGSLDPERVRDLRDADGRAFGEVVAEHGVELEALPRAVARRADLAAYLELHIEQGPVLEADGASAAAVLGTAGVERHGFRLDGQAAHAGTTPMDLRRDAGLTAAAAALAVEDVARRHGGVATVGSLRLEPGIPTAVPGGADAVVDLRHEEARALARMLDETRQAFRRAAVARGCSVSSRRIWSIVPVPFSTPLVEAAREACRAVTGTDRTIRSGALHDAAELARAGVPTAMIFAPSTSGLSHTPEEDTPVADLERAIEAFGALAGRVIAGELP